MDLCDLYIGSDTGLMHMAAAMKKAVIELSVALPRCPLTNGSNPARMGPWGVKAKILMPKKALDNCKDICKYPFSHCINTITPKEVVEALFDILF